MKATVTRLMNGNVLKYTSSREGCTSTISYRITFGPGPTIDIDMECVELDLELECVKHTQGSKWERVARGLPKILLWAFYQDFTKPGWKWARDND